MAIAKKAKLKSKDIIENVKDLTIYFNDHLTNYNRKLFFELRALKKLNNYTHVCCKNCVLFVRKTINGSAIRIHSLNNLQKL